MADQHITPVDGVRSGELRSKEPIRIVLADDHAVGTYRIYGSPNVV
jgi:hypothetical protein